MANSPVKRVVIDTDIAMGLMDRDVDDALAIIMARNSPGLSVCGLTLTYGNDSLSNVKRCMSELAAVAGISGIAIASGAESAGDLGKESEATMLLAEIAGQGPVSLLCLGPLTNAATFLGRHPELVDSIEEIVAVAGRRRGQRFLTGNYARSHPDLNFEKDPQAMERLISSTSGKLVFAPFEVSSKVRITSRTLDLIEGNGTGVARYLAQHCRPWLEFWQRTFSTASLTVDWFNPFDCLAVAWLTDQDLLAWELVAMAVEQADYDRGERKVQGEGSKKWYLHADFHKQAQKRFIYLYDVERETFLERLISRLH